MLTIQICLLYYYITAVNYNFSNAFNKLSLNDSLELLLVMSSPVFTILILLLLITYINATTAQSHNYMIIFVCAQLYNYFFDFNQDLNNLQHILSINNLNLNLQNGLLNIHPFCIYMLYGWVYVYVLATYLKKRSYKPKYILNTRLVFVTHTMLSGVVLGA